jgi:hypothetical protein
MYQENANDSSGLRQRWWSVVHHVPRGRGCLQQIDPLDLPELSGASTATRLAARGIAGYFRTVGRRAITRGTYDKLVIAFREVPDNRRRAARAADVHHSTATRAWLQGWPERGWPAIKGLIAADQVSARAKLLAVERKVEQEIAEDGARERARLQALASEAIGIEYEKARLQAIETRKDEGQLAKLARLNALAALATSSRMLDGVQELAKNLREQLAGKKNISPTMAALLMQRAAAVAKTSAEAAKMALQIERIYLGEPEMLIGIVAPAITAEQAAAKIERAQVAWKRAIAAGVIVVNADGHVVVEDESRTDAG